MTNIPIMLCCNDPDHGSFSGRLQAVEFGNALEALCLECCFCDWGPEIRYVSAQGHVIGIQFLINGATWQFNFVPRSWRPHVGNWCWDRAGLTPETALALLNWLKRQNETGTPWFAPTVAEQSLWKVWESAAVDFTASDLKIITGESVNNVVEVAHV